MKGKKKLIISLIKDDLRNHRLVEGLNKLGLDAGEYYLDICRAIFLLMDFQDPDSDELLDFYLNLAKKVRKIDIPRQYPKFEDLCWDIFIQLNAKKINQHNIN